MDAQLFTAFATVAKQHVTALLRRFEVSGAAIAKVFAEIR